MRIITTLLFLYIATFSVPAMADIEKRALMCNTEICFYWWPKLPTLKGWQQDEDASYNLSANTLAPVGKNFSSAPAVIYANAIYKPRVPSEKTRAEYIASDLETFKKNDPTLLVTHLPVQKTADGQVLEVYSFSPSGSRGNWEITAYGEEDMFYLTFVVSAKSKQALNTTIPVFNQLVSLYKK